MRLLIVGGMLALAFSASLAPANAGGGIMPTVHEEECDGWARGLRGWAIRCHCSFECNRKYEYTVRIPCWPEGPRNDRMLPFYGMGNFSWEIIQRPYNGTESRR
jgi:hypothetical protein